METSTVLNITLWVFSILGYVIYNLYTKNVKQEETIVEMQNLLNSLRSLIDQSDRALKEVDRLGAFKSDDEVGFFFETVKDIQEMLNKYNGK